MKKLIATCTALAAFAGTVLAQPAAGQSNKYLEYNYEKRAVKEREVLPWHSLREIDVTYAKRIDRIIDSREKKNLVMNWPKNPLHRVVYDLVTSGEEEQPGALKAYKDGDSLSTAFTVGEVKKIGGFCENIQIQDARYPDDPYALIDTTVCTSFESSEIVRWVIREEWIFDKQRSVFEPRIIAVAPLYILTIGGQEIGEYPMFWLSYQELRPILIREEVFNRHNDAMHMTFYDFFETRQFTSYIAKESNELDMDIRNLEQFKDDPMEALYESERIKEVLFNWEHDLWEY